MILEKQLLPDAALKPAYDKAVWIYVYRDFSDSSADLTAERISLRFSVTSWPQHFLADPDTLDVLSNTGRAVPTFLSAVNRAATRVRPASSLDASKRIDQADVRAVALETGQSVSLAKQYVADSDVAVRFRALEILAEKDMDTVVKDAQQLLQVPNDAFRYEVCKVLTKTGVTRAANALEEIVRLPTKSRNPNVLRISAVKALGSCGNTNSVDVIGPFACSGDYRNGLTGVAVDAVVASQIDPKAESKIVPIQEVPEDWMALDIGPATSRLFAEVLDDAKTIVWNGPMGIFEMDAFSRGTVSMVHSVANSYALTIVGGGDTDVAVHSAGQSDRFSYISTGGGAFLYLMEGKILPGVAALDNLT